MNRYQKFRLHPKTKKCHNLLYQIVGGGSRHGAEIRQYV